jgi:hypothetical protein
MGWLPGYENDIFISYAHDDNLPQFGPNGWIDYFEEHLRIMTQGMLGKGPQGEKLKIYRDSRLRRFGGFDEQLARSLADSAVFICVLSPNYLTSEWCRWELDEFLKQAHSSRILKAVIRPVNEQEQPEELRRTLDSYFYRINESSGLFNELRPQINKEDVADYAVTLETLAQNVVELLKQIRRAQPGERGGSQVVANATQEIVVYLAETASDLSKECSDIKNELQQFNYRVLPDQPLPQDTDELLAAVRTYMQQARLSVHMFGKKYGARPDSEDRSIPHIQYDLAVELNKEQLIWLPKEIIPENVQQLQFVEHVRKQSRDWQENKLEDFKSEILKRLKPEPALDPDAAETESVNICLFYHEDDALDISPLFSHLTIKELFEVKLSREAVASPQQCKDLLQTSDAVLLYYGKSNLQWLVNILKQIRRFTTLPRNKPLLAQAIYSTAPQTEEKISLAWDDPLVIHNYKEFTADVIAPFINRIRAGKGAAI